MPSGDPDNSASDNSASDNSAPVDAPTPVGVRVLLFSVLREYVGAGEVEVTLPAPATGRTLLDHLAERFPALRDYRPVVHLAVNEQYAPPDTPLSEGDEVALITPVSGG
jgi:molybdopterin converting factor subunit 1